MANIQFDQKLTNEIKVSPAAIEQLIAITSSEEDVNGIRIFVSGGGCGGMTYGLTFVDKPSSYDRVLESKGLNIYVDSVALSFLEGVEIDYKTEGLNTNFVFSNVFANSGGSGTCGGCGGAG
ncbi:MAG: iron-sulfur cluster assembly accessory protein [Gammaproteobacteria bacterium]|nr:iron-sulfur cluster assembly accessory protein [Gammaproteobacteria bacterium]